MRVTADIQGGIKDYEDLECIDIGCGLKAHPLVGHQ